MNKQTQIFFEEENFLLQMNHTILPFLDSIRNHNFLNCSQHKLHYEEYIHPEERAAIVISHGFCEFTRKYDEVIYNFYNAGYSVYIVDHLGHGYSERMVEDLDKVHISSYNEYLASFHTFMQEIVINGHTDRKLVLFGHSMGGAISTLYIEEHPAVFDCAILSSPMLAIDYGKNPAILVWLVMKYMKLRNRSKEYAPGSNGFDVKPVFETSSCLSKARYDYIFSHRLKDKHYQTYGATCSWIEASMKAVKKIQKQAHTVSLPILLFQAELDTMVNPKGQHTFANKSQNTKLVLIPNAKHEIFNALTEARIDFYNQIFNYLDQNLS